MNTCELCGGGARRNKDFVNYLGSYATDFAIYAESGHYIVSPDKHPVIADPYYLIYPKDHVTSFQLLQPNHDNEIHELIQYIKDLSHKRSVIVFEHGQMRDGNKVKSVYHAHTHVIPTNAENVLERVKEDIIKRRGRTDSFTLDSYGAIKKLHDVDPGDYLLFHQDGVALYVQDNGSMDIPSQYFRVLLQQIMIPESPFINWKHMSTSEADVFKQRVSDLPHKI
ncbi:MAG: hypothetical protein WDA75_17700 [Candidatus Latescibacterota bacterium]|jgi:diadenosine tetraphosphate (Ap4A) HIT family hydrolase